MLLKKKKKKNVWILGLRNWELIKTNIQKLNDFSHHASYFYLKAFIVSIVALLVIYEDKKWIDTKEIAY